MDRRVAADGHRVPPLRPTFAILAAALLGAAPAAADGDLPSGEVQARIVNGHAPTQAWPAQTSVRFSTSSGSYLCGGTLVSGRWVLTAAHCATNDSGAALAPSAFSLRVGSTSRTSGGFASSVDTVVRHPSYSETGAPSNDLALLRLTAAAPQEPMRLIGTTSAETALWAGGVEATVIGWGVTETGSQSSTLLEAQVPMVSDGACLRAWGSGFSSTSMVCAGGASSDTCGGDSGGPLMVPRGGAFALVGVTSWGSDPCGRLGMPGVYARLGATAINAWLRSRVPTADVAASPALPIAGEPVTLSATVAPGSQVSAPALAWDLDDDGAFDDATGATATATFVTAGSHVVRAQARFPDGDRAVAREAVKVAAAPPPPIATPAPAPEPESTAPVVTPPPPPPAPAPQPPPSAQPQPEPAAPQAAAAPLGKVTVPARLRLRTLRASGVRVTFRCARACGISGRLTLDARTARRLRLTTGRRAVTIGRASASRSSAGSGRLTVRLTARARRALRNRSRVTVRMATVLRSGAARLDGARSISVRR
jgi:hypothetical protein